MQAKADEVIGRIEDVGARRGDIARREPLYLRQSWRDALWEVVAVLPLGLFALWIWNPWLGLLWCTLVGPPLYPLLRQVISGRDSRTACIEFEDYTLRVRHGSGEVARAPYWRISYVGSANRKLTIEHGSVTLQIDASDTSPEDLEAVVEEIRAHVVARAPTGALTEPRGETLPVSLDWNGDALEVEFTSSVQLFSVRFLHQMGLVGIVAFILLESLTSWGVLSGDRVAFLVCLTLAGAAFTHNLWNERAPATKLRLTREALIVTTRTELRLALDEIQAVEVDGGAHAAIAIQTTGEPVEIRANGNTAESLRNLRAQILAAKASYMKFLESDAAVDPGVREQMKNLISDAREGE